MPDVANLQIEIDSKQVRAAHGDLRDLERQGARTESRFTSMGEKAQRMGRQLTTWLTLPILGGGAAAIKTAADYETLRTQLEVLVGSAEVANKVFGDLTEFAATTPFEIDGIVRANNLLLGFGVSIDQTQELLRTLGDVAAVSGGDLFSMARVFGEARAEGKLLTRDLRQLIAQGVPIIQLLAESMGVAESAIFEMATAGEISFEKLVEAFEKATAEGGLFFGGMEKRSNTLAGIFSNAMDSINQSLASVGQTIIDVLDVKDVVRGLVANLDQATAWFNNLDGSTQRMIITLGLLLAAAGPVIGILGTLSLAIGAISAPVLATVAVIGTGTALIISNWKEVEAYFRTGGGAQIWTDLRSIVQSTTQIITDAWEGMGDGIVYVATESFTKTIEIVEYSLTRIADMMKSFNGEMSTELNVFEDSFVTTFRKVDNIVASAMGKAFRGTMRSFKWLFSELFGGSGDEAARSAEEMIKRAHEALDFLDMDFDLIPAAKESKAAVDELIRSIGGIKPSIEAIPPIDEIIFPDDDLFRRIDRHMKMFNSSFNEAYESVSALPPSFDDLQDSVDYFLDIDWSDRLGVEEVRELGSAIASVRQPMERFLSDAATDMMFFQEETKLVRNEFGELEEQTYTLQDRMSELFNSLLQDISRTLTQLLVIKPLMDSLFGENSSSGEIGGLLQRLLPSGGSATVEPTDDLIITDNGRVFKPHPDDTIMAMKNLSPVFNNQNSVSAPVYVNVHNSSDSQVEVQESRGPGGEREVEVFVRNAVKGLMNSGQLDRTMSQNYGVRRKGVNYG